MGENCVYKVPSANGGPCLVLGRDSSREDSETISATHCDPHHPHFSSLPKGHVMPNGVCPSSGSKMTAGSDSQAEPASGSTADCEYDSIIGSVSLSKCAATCGRVDETAAGSHQESLMVVDDHVSLEVPAGRSDAEESEGTRHCQTENSKKEFHIGEEEDPLAGDEGLAQTRPISRKETQPNTPEKCALEVDGLKCTQEVLSPPGRLKNTKQQDSNSGFLDSSKSSTKESKVPETMSHSQPVPPHENARIDKPDHVEINIDTEQSTTQTVDTQNENFNEIQNTHNETEDQDPTEEDKEEEDHLGDEEGEEKEDDEDMEEEDEVHSPAKAGDIDRGWAWVVLVSGFLGMTIFGTFTFSIGIFQAEILQVVEPDIKKTSWVGATHFSTLCMMGPFAGLIKTKLGNRKTVLMSSIIICGGMIAASLSVNVTQLIITYGIITGIGTGMALNPMFVCVSFYFERYRGFASGVIAAGAGAGMFVGGPIIRQLMETYGLSGTFLIWGAVGLNIGVAGMVMTPSSLEREKEQEQKEMVVNKIWKVDSAMLASVSTLPSAGGYWGSVLGLSSFLMWEKEADALTLQQSQILLDVPEIQGAIQSYNELSTLSPEVMETAVRSTWRARNFWSSQLSVGDSLDSASTGRRRFSPWLLRKNSPTKDSKQIREPEKCSLQPEEVSPSKFRDGDGGSRCMAVLDLFRILSHPAFSLYMFSASMWIFGESIVYAYLPTYAQAQGSSPFQSAILITALGFTSTFSRLVMGFVAAHPSIGPDVMHVSMLGLCGLFTLTFPLYATSFSGQIAYAAIYGLYAGGLASVINILIISLIGVQHIALAFGLICFGQGVASLAGPSLSGLIVSAGGNYDHVFLFSGSLLLVGGFAGFPMVLFKKRPTPPPEEEADVEKAKDTITPIEVRIQGDVCYT